MGEIIALLLIVMFIRMIYLALTSAIYDFDIEYPKKTNWFGKVWCYIEVVMHVFSRIILAIFLMFILKYIWYKFKSHMNKE